MTLAVQILLLIATAFLTVALGSLAAGATAATLFVYFLVSLASGIIAILWASARFRAWLPFARPWKMRLHALWLEADELRRPAPQLTGDASGDLVSRVADFERRLWMTIADELPERASVLESQYGDRLAAGVNISNFDLQDRLLKQRNLLAQLISGTI